MFQKSKMCFFSHKNIFYYLKNRSKTKRKLKRKGQEKDNNQQENKRRLANTQKFLQQVQYEIKDDTKRQKQKKRMNNNSLIKLRTN